MKKLFMVVNEDRFFLSHRKEIAVRAMKNGFDVTIVTKNTGQKQQILDLGLKVIDLSINPTGMNPIQESKTLLFLIQLYLKEKPDIVHHVGLKNILWGSLAARMTGIKGVVNAVSGLGVAFSNESKPLVAKAILAILKVGHKRNGLQVIFQNHEDECLFLSHHIIKKNQVVFIKGSGVDLQEYKETPEPDNAKVRILFTGRMVEEKGVKILIDAANLLRNKYENKIEFILCGGLSNNPKAMKEEYLYTHCDGKYVQWLGFRKDIKEQLMQSNIVAFPSYYREGVPKSLIEATAIGRAIVTTQSVGCQDTVEDGYNGFLIPIKDAKSLAEEIEILVNDPILRKQMGHNSRLIAERDFSLENVVDKHLVVYHSLFDE